MRERRGGSLSRKMFSVVAIPRFGITRISETWKCQGYEFSNTVETQDRKYFFVGGGTSQNRKFPHSSMQADPNIPVDKLWGEKS